MNIPSRLTMVNRTEDVKKPVAARKAGRESIAKIFRDQNALAAAERKRRAEEKEKKKQQKEKNQAAQSNVPPPVPMSPSLNQIPSPNAQVPKTLTTPKASTTAANVYITNN